MEHQYWDQLSICFSRKLLGEVCAPFCDQAPLEVTQHTQYNTQYIAPRPKAAAHSASAPVSPRRSPPGTPGLDYPRYKYSRFAHNAKERLAATKICLPRPAKKGPPKIRNIALKSKSTADPEIEEPSEDDTFGHAAEGLGPSVAAASTSTTS